MYIFYIVKQKWFLTLLLVINILGTIYGYVWYSSQLEVTPIHFLPFVPDSPTASLFFVIVLIGFLLRKHFALFEALAAITLFKYGIWAVAMNVAGMAVTNTATIAHWMLIFSHFGMAVQALLYAPFYRIKRSHFLFAAIWVIHNDFIDYVYDMFPVYPSLSEYIPLIGYLTFWLSIITLFIFYQLTLNERRFSLPLIENKV